MEFLKFLRQESTDVGTKLVLVAFASGILHAVLVSFIIGTAGTISPDQVAFQSLFLCVLLVGALISCRYFVLSGSSALTERIVCKVRLRMIDKIREADLLFFERLGTAPVYKTFARDTMTLSNTAMTMSNAFSHVILLVFATVYIGLLSKEALFLTVLCLGVGVLAYWKQRQRVQRCLQASDVVETRFFELLNHVLHGFKELKMNRLRSDDLYRNEVEVASRDLRDLQIQANKEWSWAAILTEVFFFILLAAIIFILPSVKVPQSENPETIRKVSAAVLFIMGPLSQIVAAAANVFRGNEAAVNIRKLEEQLDHAFGNQKKVPLAPVVRGEQFHEIALQEVLFRYEPVLNGGNGFVVGPLSLSIPRGEILFLAGGNGSGKSTLLKLLAGLYFPPQGFLKLDGRVVNRENGESYRQLCSAVFTDFHLFDQLYGVEKVRRDKLLGLLDEMELSHKTGVEGRRFATTDLSVGQRKRLALVVALFEERPILLFDELAADQDPEFRRYFYECVLLRLKTEGRTIILATHDDRYFHVADRVIKLEYGQIVSNESPARTGMLGA
jgi:putative pyoverdin transport system ATP-binding/permease protein